MRLVFVGLLLTAAFGVALTGCVNESWIRKELLEKTPTGTSMNQVLELCSREKMTCKRSDSAGYLNQDTGKGVGVKSIWGIFLERKTTPLTIVTVEVFWGFDKDGKLLDIWVWKTVDAP